MKRGKDIFDEKKLESSRDIRLFKQLYPFIHPYRKLLSFAVFLMLLITLLELLIPYITKIAIDRYIVPGHSDSPKNPAQQVRYLTVDVTDPDVQKIIADNPGLFHTDAKTARIANDRFSQLSEPERHRLRSRDLTGVALAAAGLLCIIVINLFLEFGQAMIIEYTGQMIMHDLRMALFSHIQKLSIRFFTRNPVGRLVTRVTNDIQNMYDMFTSVLVFSLKDIFLLLGITVILFVIDWRLSLVVYAVMPAVLYASFKFAGTAREAFRTLRIKAAEINTRFSETIGGMQVIQLFGRESMNLKNFEKLNHENYLAGMRQITVFALFMPFVELMSAFVLALVIFHGGGSLIAHRISLGTLVLFIFYLRMFFEPIRDIAEKYNITLNALSSAERIFLILEETDMLPQPETPAPAPKRMQSLRFDHVHFSYLPGEPVLKDISFTIEAGETLAVVGPTGAGKTSLAGLIIRFYDPDSGRILINGTDIRDFKTADLRSMTAMVMQEPFLFSGSIADNIFSKNHPADQAAVDRVLEASHCKSFIDRLPGGVGFVLSGGGASLSSGQRQLICIARALAADPELILFDEATSHIDSETEQKIQNALANLMKGRTAILIAHRLSTARIADRILVMDGGRIVESGSHEALIRQKGFYFHLNQFQG